MLGPRVRVSIFSVRWGEARIKKGRSVNYNSVIAALTFILVGGVMGPFYVIRNKQMRKMNKNRPCVNPK